MGVLNASKSLKLSLFSCPPASLGFPESARPSRHRPVGGPYSSTLWPIRADSSRFRPLLMYPLADKGLGPVGDPYPCTLWPFRRLATYPSYPNRVGHPCPRTSSKFLSLATYPLGLGGVRAAETFIFSGKRSPGGLQTSLCGIKLKICRNFWPNRRKFGA